jgi:formylglycine-generating enzyme required for sulfatase activity
MGVQPVGTHPMGASPFGVFDQAGNANEWVADWYSPTYYWTAEASQPDPQGPASGTARVEKGGSYWFGTPRIAFRDSDPPDSLHPDASFRCARSLP